MIQTLSSTFSQKILGKLMLVHSSVPKTTIPFYCCKETRVMYNIYMESSEREYGKDSMKFTVWKGIKSCPLLLNSTLSPVCK